MSSEYGFMVSLNETPVHTERNHQLAVLSTPVALGGARDDRPSQLIDSQIAAARIAIPGTIQHSPTNNPRVDLGGGGGLGLFPPPFSRLSPPLSYCSQDFHESPDYV